MDKVTDKIEHDNLGRLVLDGLLREVVKKRHEAYARLHNEEIKSRRIPTAVNSINEVEMSATGGSASAAEVSG